MLTRQVHTPQSAVHDVLPPDCLLDNVESPSSHPVMKHKLTKVFLVMPAITCGMIASTRQEHAHRILRLELLLQMVSTEQDHLRILCEALVRSQIPDTFMREAWHRHDLRPCEHGQTTATTR